MSERADQPTGAEMNRHGDRGVRHGDRGVRPTSPVLVALAWLAVGVPLAYGLWQTILKAIALFVG